MNLLNTATIAKEMQTKVTERMGDWFEAEFKAKANAASRRTRLIRSQVIPILMPDIKIQANCQVT